VEPQEQVILSPANLEINADHRRIGPSSFATMKIEPQEPVEGTTVQVPLRGASEAS
jgi:hypothetical protein